MKSAERELLEIERKRSAADIMKSSTGALPSTSSSGRKSSSMAPAGSVEGSASVSEGKVAELTKQVVEEVRRLNQHRDKLKSLQTDTVSSLSKTDESSLYHSSALDTAKPHRGAPFRVIPVPEGLAPELCRCIYCKPVDAIVQLYHFLFYAIRMLVKAGYDGITKVVNQFVTKYPTMSKRQIELKIGELAVKEKHDEDKGKVWHIRPQFAHYLQIENFDETEGIPPAPSSTNAAAIDSEKKSKKKKETPLVAFDSANSKRKREDDGAEPKKYKTAFNIFVKAVRADAEAELKAKNNGESPSVRLNMPHWNSVFCW